MKEMNSASFKNLNLDFYNHYISLGLKPSRFTSYDDTDLFCRLVEKAVNLYQDDIINSRGKFLGVDLGHGSGIPTIHMYSSIKPEYKDVASVVGIDIDNSEKPEEKSAISISMENRAKMGLEKKFTIVDYNMVDLLKSPEKAICEINKNNNTFENGIDLLVSNFPYVPIDDETNDKTTNLTCHGGPDGTYFMKALLNSDICDKIAFQIGSFSNPFKALHQINKNAYGIDFAGAVAVPFGDYTSRDDVLSHLKKIREKGTSYFADIDHNKSNYSYLVLGFVINKEKKNDFQQVCDMYKELLDGFQDKGIDFLKSFNHELDFEIQLGSYDFNEILGNNEI